MVTIITITISFDTASYPIFNMFSCKINSRQFFGDPIECDAGAVRDFFSHFLIFIGQANAAVEQDVLDSYCWMYSTWNVPRWFTMVLSSNNYCLRKREG